MCAFGIDCHRLNNRARGGELEEILPVVNILQTLNIRALVVRKIGLASAVGTGDPDFLSGHQPACLFSPFAVTGHQCSSSKEDIWTRSPKLSLPAPGRRAFPNSDPHADPWAHSLLAEGTQGVVCIFGHLCAGENTCGS